MNVVSVSRDDTHRFSKVVQPQIELLAGLGVAGDAHAGVTVKHRSRVKRDPNQPNLRQVHLIESELLDELAGQGFTVQPADLGENILTQGLDLASLPRATRLHLGSEAVVEVTGLRNPCAQIDNFQSGLLKAVLGKDEQGQTLRKAGIMGLVICGGVVQSGDKIRVELPPTPHVALDIV